MRMLKKMDIFYSENLIKWRSQEVFDNFSISHLVFSSFLR
jgi:hypothetical protein